MWAETQLMDSDRLAVVLEEHCDIVKEGDGRWVVAAGGRKLVVHADPSEDRLRIIAPVVPFETLTDRDARVVLGANFDRALDARYAAAGGYLWAEFVHSLSEVTHRQVLEGVRQVIALADNYGTSYSAGGSKFTGGRL